MKLLSFCESKNMVFAILSELKFSLVVCNKCYFFIGLWLFVFRKQVALGTIRHATLAVSLLSDHVLFVLAHIIMSHAT